MTINKEEIEKIANLAKLDLNENEKEKYAQQFSSILSFIDTLNELNISGDQILGLESDASNQLRGDEVFSCDEDSRKLSLSQSPEIENNQIKVKRVL